MHGISFKSYKIGEKLFIIIVHAFLFFFVLLCVLPFLTVLARSLSPEVFIKAGRVSFWPIHPTLDGYKKVFESSYIIIGFKNTVFVAIFGTIINLTMSSILAYPLSRKRTPFRKVFITLVIIAMLFYPGMIPSYLLVKSLGLLNSRWALILPGAISTFNMIIIKNYFESIPDSLEESALIDGAGELTILFRIMVPLAKPVMAAMGLFYFIGNWNVFIPVILYITDAMKYTIQPILQDILRRNAADFLIPTDPALRERYGELVLQSTITIIGMLPILIVYPFLQKYFVKGIMIGSIKG
jgi:ABC-type glycerol-3-phosphate transport system permease component